jgi:hypothetical protein
LALTQAHQTLAQYQSLSPSLPSVQLFSALARTGIADAAQVVQGWLKL